MLNVRVINGSGKAKTIILPETTTVRDAFAAADADVGNSTVSIDSRKTEADRFDEPLSNFATGDSVTLMALPKLQNARSEA